MKCNLNLILKFKIYNKRIRNQNKKRQLVIMDSNPIDMNRSSQYINKADMQQKLKGIIRKLYHQQFIQIVEFQSPRDVKLTNKKSDHQKIKSDQKLPLSDNPTIWKQLIKQFKLPQQTIINMLYVNQDLVLFCIQFLCQLQFTDQSKTIISDLVKKIDPSLKLIRNLIKPLVKVLQQSGHQLNTLNVVIFTLKTLFLQQTPINEQLDSYIQLYGGQGIKCDQVTRWPFQKSGTITIWFCMDKKTHQCKLFEIKNSQGIGFQIILKNNKLYFQKIFEEKKFRLMQNNSAYLCDCQYQKYVKLSVEFQIKKRFFHPNFSINVIMNNFVMTNIEVDTISYNLNDFRITMFKHFYGKFYSALILKSNLSGQVEQLNSNKGFIYQNDIKNFAYIFDTQVKNVCFLYSAIRAIAVYGYEFQSNVNKQNNDQQDNSIKTQNSQKLQFIQDSQTQELQISIPKSQFLIPQQYNFLYPIRRPKQVHLFDAINRFNGKITQKGNVYQNISIKKEILNYGSLKSYLPFLQLLKLCASKSEDFKTALSGYLQLIKSIFLNKTQSLEEAYKIRFFKILAKFFDQIKLEGFDIQIICSLKQVYVTLNTRMMRQSFVKQLVWGIKNAIYLDYTQFQAFIKFIKTFYNQDIQSMLVSFGIKDIINFILDNYDSPNCCFQHTRASIDGANDKKIQNYFKIVKQYFTLLQNILLIKRNQIEQLEKLMRQILTIFTLNASACFIQAFILFLSQLFSRDSFLQKHFIELMNTQNYKLSVYMCLAYSYSWKTKTKLIQLVLHVFGPSIIRQFSDEQKDQKHFISLCIKFPVIMHIPMRQSSIKSQDREYSIDQSQDKLSMNSTNLKRYTVMKTVDQEDIESLLNEEDIARVILQWSFSQQVVEKMEENQNVGISILMEIYKGSTYKIRKYITNLLVQNQKLLSLGSAIMPSFIECLFLCEYDSEYFLCKDQIVFDQIKQTKRNLLHLICSYKTDYESNQLPQLLILKLIIASVKAKFTSEVSKLSNRVYLLISDSMFKRYLQELKREQWKDQSKFNLQCQKIINNAYKTLVQYFCQRGQQNQLQFQEQFVEMAQKQYCIMILVLQKILDLLIYITAPNVNSTLMSDGNSKRNKFIATILFPIEKKQTHVCFFNFVFVILQTIFQNFQDLNNNQRKAVLTLQKKYLIFMIQLTQNSNDLQIQTIEDQLKNIFLIVLAFLQNKFYQYFYYGFQKHKHLQFTIQGKIRKNVQDTKTMIFNIFLDLIEMIKQLDEIGSMQHKSFYDLMKPKRKNAQKSTIKNFYPQLWKKTDDKIIEFMCLPIKVLRQEAKQKLQTHLIQKRLSLVSSSIQKSLTKKIQKFINDEKKTKVMIEEKSVYSYISRQSSKCKKLSETEQQITILKYQYGQKQKLLQIKRKQNQQKNKRQINNIKRKIFNFNRSFGGLWQNQKFFNFCQNDHSVFRNEQNLYNQSEIYNNSSFNYVTSFNNNSDFINNSQLISKDFDEINDLKLFYKRVRSKKQSEYLTIPIIKIVALPIKSDQEKSFQEIYLNEMLSSRRDYGQPRQQTLKSQKYLKIGLAFIKKKVIQKFMKKGINLSLSLGFTKQNETIEDHHSQGQKFFTKKAIWIKPMLICQVNIELNQKSLIIYHQSSHSYQHLSLLKNEQKQYDLLMKEYKLQQIQCYQIRTFMLKATAVQLFFATGKSIFISFYGKSESVFNKFIEFLNKYKKFPLQDKISLPLRLNQPIKGQDHFYVTQKWINREISNFEYLMSLNILSGRSNNDLNQYFVFPWILSHYEKDKQLFRDLSLNMGSLGSKQRLQKFKQIKENLQNAHKDQFPQAHNFGFHYSNIAIVLQYLIRINPYSQGSKQLQGGKFDIPDRLFHSITQSYNNSTQQMSDIRQLIPQFFYFPQFLINTQKFDFGTQQSNKLVDSVELPTGFSNSYQFIERHRQLLESTYVSINLHSWIDLIFGYKQIGKQAQFANNNFHYLAYEHNYCYVNQQNDGSEMKQAMESHMAYFGKIPSQIFTKPHPKRTQIQNEVIKQIAKIKNAEPFKNIVSNLNVDSLLTKHLNGFFSLLGQTPIFSYFSEYTKRHLILRRNGQGLIFSMDRQSKTNKSTNSLSIQQNFQLFIDKHESMYTFDQTIFFQNLPITCFWTQFLVFGGIWGGRIIKYDIKNQKFNVYGKHSDTISALFACEHLQILISGSINGQVVIWSFQNKLYSNSTSVANQPNSPSILNQPKLMFRDKIVIHSDRINHININKDLKVGLISSRDGYLSILDIQKCEVIRMIKLSCQVTHSLLLNYPYYCLFIECLNNKQYCYSLNGQLLNSFEFFNLQHETCSLKINNKEMILLKQKQKNYFQLFQLPKLKNKQFIYINQEDNNIFNFTPSVRQNRVQILFNTINLMIHVSHPIQNIN